MEKILFISVVYGAKPVDCTTLISLSKLDFEMFNISAEFAIWDNSVHGYGYDSIPKLQGHVYYYHTGRNEYLSKVYNNIISKHDDVDWVVILDDDSVIDEAYLTSLNQFFESNLDLALPKIVYNDQLISPGMQHGVRGKCIPSNSLLTGKNSSKFMVAMMSGTIIRRNLFTQGFSFDERLSFYGVDTRFFIDYSELKSELFVLDVVMQHHSALRDYNQSLASQLNRLNNLFLSKKIVFENLPFNRIRLLTYLVFFIVNQSIKRRTLSTFSLIKLLPKLI